jgi:hypothetical protein
MCELPLTQAKKCSAGSPAEGIMPSGHVNRANRPNTWLLRPTLQSENSPCQPDMAHSGDPGMSALTPLLGQSGRKSRKVPLLV